MDWEGKGVMREVAFNADLSQPRYSAQRRRSALLSVERGGHGAAYRQVRLRRAVANSAILRFRNVNSPGTKDSNRDLILGDVITLKAVW